MRLWQISQTVTTPSVSASPSHRIPSVSSQGSLKASQPPSGKPFRRSKPFRIPSASPSGAPRIPCFWNPCTNTRHVNPAPWSLVHPHCRHNNSEPSGLYLIPLPVCTTLDSMSAAAASSAPTAGVCGGSMPQDFFYARRTEYIHCSRVDTTPNNACPIARACASIP